MFSLTLSGDKNITFPEHGDTALGQSLADLHKTYWRSQKAAMSFAMARLQEFKVWTENALATTSTALTTVSIIHSNSQQYTMLSSSVA
jgi:hypothetical protein